MVVSNSQSKLISAPSSLDLSLEHLSISSAKEHLGVTDEDISLHVLFPVDLQEQLQKSQTSPFHVWYVKDEVWPSRACADENGRGMGDCFACFPTSPINIPFLSKRDTWRSPPTKRESLLQEAWERKQELYLKQELANLKERANVQRLGRSSSDCGKHTKVICEQAKHELLARSMSDCSKSKKDPLVTPNRLGSTCTRCLTDDDFDELKGCLDLGFQFDQSSIPDLCDTIPALEVFCAVNQNFQEFLTPSPEQSSMPSPTPSWRITSPGDDPKEVREKLRHWAQAVACSARLGY